MKTDLRNEPWLTSVASKQVMSLLNDAGHEAWFVGGCVRNALINAPVSDLDVTTTAHPEVVMSLAKGAGLKVIPTGIEHGTVTVICGGEPYEITTLRRDVATDGRRATVAFADTIEEDAARRDFTMNALYADAEGSISDPTGGIADLAVRCIRFIGDASERIREDYLRSLRFFRFYAWYGDVDEGPDPEALAAISMNLGGLETLSRERIGAEILKILSASDPAPAMACMQQTGVLTHILPGAETGMLGQLVHIEGNISVDPIRRLACIGGEDVAEKLRLSKAQNTRLDLLLDQMGSLTPVTEIAYRHSFEVARNVSLLRANMAGLMVADADLDAAKSASQAQFPVFAKDLMPEYSGKALGDQLKKLEQAWIDGGFKATKEDLLSQ
ncbi:CCA tRNA nucleotidyltransferase [Halocynthiibacter styelae]|uniref:CCA tRNA nucleotidyltransferase n=1 Tax=Halocynthiibacter styelae TaxID=2761955 RepID=A0A8J7LW72_9RHOB|nr:CCA tRNA nucleotidyltransferase [Paenihalocynthiibacter styelae]MBI1493972.1 CCA tRNA nucleotidyltransferase [Paenihalocynthiibacter styelae]